MDIPTYKIHHVLEAYARRLAQEKTRSDTPGRDRSRQPPDGRQQELIDQVSDRIIRRARDLADDPADRIGEAPAPWGSAVPKPPGVFVYDEILPDGRRLRRTLSLDDASLLAEGPGNGVADEPEPDD